MDLKIVKGTVVTAAETRRPEVGIAGGRVVAVAPKIPELAQETIDAAGFLVQPGCAEVHMHLGFLPAGVGWADGQREDWGGSE